MTTVEEALWADDRRRGGVHALVGLALGAGVGRLAGRSVVGTAAVTWATVAGRELRSVGAEVARVAETGGLDEARLALRSLVGRDTSALDESGIAAAIIESMAENTVDAVIGAAWWGALLGAPGAAGYRAVNTMDAMVGHRSPRHARYGTASARLDDVANVVPARLFAVLLAAVVPARAVEILRTVRRDAPAHPSPNAGVAETAMAAALGVELGGPLRYGERVEERPTLGVGPRPALGDVHRAIELSSRVEWAALALLTTVAVGDAQYRHLGARLVRASGGTHPNRGPDRRARDDRQRR